MNPPQSPQIPNKANNPEAPMSYRYERAYESLFSQLSEQIQARVLAVRSNKNITDRMVDIFINDVIALAESDKEL